MSIKIGLRMRSIEDEATCATRSCTGTCAGPLMYSTVIDPRGFAMSFSTLGTCRSRKSCSRIQ